MTIYGPDIKMGGVEGMFHKDYIDWVVRCEYELLNKSINKDEPRSFKIIFNVSASHTKEAWDLAMKAFSMELLVENKIYGIVEMSVRIEA